MFSNTQIGATLRIFFSNFLTLLLFNKFSSIKSDEKLTALTRVDKKCLSYNFHLWKKMLIILFYTSKCMKIAK